MTTGLIVLFVALGVAELAALAWRRRALRRRAEAAEWAENEAWLERLRIHRGVYPLIDGAPLAGWPVYVAPVGTMPDDVAAYVLAGLTADPEPIVWERHGDPLADLEKARALVMDVHRTMTLVANPRALTLITGV